MDITELKGHQPASEESQELSRRNSDLGPGSLLIGAGSLASRPGRLTDSLVVYPEHHFLDAVDQSLDGA